ncbi:MAG: Rieske 2Fe-2S domain-containing protein, partial [Planctomycetales bacterium]|nr:Rieske 2Fe-2S domain-containing protein [Planctomycetales bacterium]
MSVRARTRGETPRWEDFVSGSRSIVAEFTTVAKVGEIKEGLGQAYAVNGRMVAVFKVGDEYHAIDDFCPHMGASLACA